MSRVEHLPGLIRSEKSAAIEAQSENDQRASLAVKSFVNSDTNLSMLIKLDS